MNREIVIKLARATRIYMNQRGISEAALCRRFNLNQSQVNRLTKYHLASPGVIKKITEVYTREGLI